MKSKLLIIALAALLVLLPSIALAQSTYTVDSGDMNYLTLNGHQIFARDMNGRFHTIYVKLYTTIQEVYHAYSDDGGLNWTSERITLDGAEEARYPAFAITSNNDLHVLYRGNDPTYYYLRYIHYDYSESVWSAVSTVDIAVVSEQFFCPDITVDSQDNIHICYRESNGQLSYMNKIYGGDGIWDSWSAEYAVDAGGADACSIAADKDDNVGIAWQNKDATSRIQFILRLENGSWNAEENVSAQTNYYTAPDLAATVESGITIWRCCVTDRTTGNNNVLSYQKQETGGAWSLNSSFSVTFGTGYVTIGLTNGSGPTDNGNFYMVWGDNNNDIKYREYELGVGWDDIKTLYDDNTNNSPLSANDQFYPYLSESNLHLQLPNSGVVVMHGDEGSDAGWGDGDEAWLYSESEDGWGGFPPIVETVSITDITEDSATINGSIIGTSPNCTIVGAQYGLTQTPTWSEYTTGNYTDGDYTINITDLESDTIYYARFYATNPAGDGCGDWIGFIASQPSYADDEITDDDGLTPPNPDEPGGWIRPPKDWGDFNGIPWTFIAFLFIAGGMTAIGLLITRATRNVIILFGVLGFIMAFFCIFPRGGYLDWWVAFPYIIVGWALIKRDQQAPLG